MSGGAGRPDPTHGTGFEVFDEDDFAARVAGVEPSAPRPASNRGPGRPATSRSTAALARTAAATALAGLAGLAIVLGLKELGSPDAPRDRGAVPVLPAAPPRPAATGEGEQPGAPGAGMARASHAGERADSGVSVVGVPAGGPTAAPEDASTPVREPARGVPVGVQAAASREFGFER